MHDDLSRLHENLQKRFDALRARLDQEGITPQENARLTDELRALCDEANNLLQKTAAYRPPPRL
jgi:hypothetical protein